VRYSGERDRQSVLNPEIVVIGGGISAQENYLRPRIEKGLDRYLIPEVRRKTKLGFAKFGNHAGMLGACCAAGILEKYRMKDQ